MKFLVDRCGGARLAEYLRSEGHDVLESRALGPDPGDPVLLEWAVALGRVLVTIDTNFGKLVFVDKGRTSPWMLKCFAPRAFYKTHSKLILEKCRIRVL